MSYAPWHQDNQRYDGAGHRKDESLPQSGKEGDKILNDFSDSKKKRIFAGLKIIEDSNINDDYQQ